MLLLLTYTTLTGARNCRCWTTGGRRGPRARLDPVPSPRWRRARRAHFAWGNFVRPTPCSVRRAALPASHRGRTVAPPYRAAHRLDFAGDLCSPTTPSERAGTQCRPWRIPAGADRRFLPSLQPCRERRARRQADILAMARGRVENGGAHSPRRQAEPGGWITLAPGAPACWERLPMTQPASSSAPKPSPRAVRRSGSTVADMARPRRTCPYSGASYTDRRDPGVPACSAEAISPSRGRRVYRVAVLNIAANGRKPHGGLRALVAPPFPLARADLFGPFELGAPRRTRYTEHAGRATHVPRLRGRWSGEASSFNINNSAFTRAVILEHPFDERLGWSRSLLRYPESRAPRAEARARGAPTWPQPVQKALPHRSRAPRSTVDHGESFRHRPRFDPRRWATARYATGPTSRHRRSGAGTVPWPRSRGLRGDPHGACWLTHAGAVRCC